MGDLGKLIGAKGFKKLPKVQYIAISGHTGTQNAAAELKSYIKAASWWKVYLVPRYLLCYLQCQAKWTSWRR